MKKLTLEALCQQLIISTVFFVTLSLFSITVGLPTKDSLLVRINNAKHQCVFPRSDLKLDICSGPALESQPLPDFKKHVNYYLCAALLDSVSRLCPLVKKNKKFGERVEKALNESYSASEASEVSNSMVCDEMNVLDPNTSMAEAKLFYNKTMNKRYCTPICYPMDDDELSMRLPICKSIKFAHEQIQTAIHIQESLNSQDHVEEKVVSSGVNNRNDPSNVGSLNPDPQASQNKNSSATQQQTAQKSLDVHSPGKPVSTTDPVSLAKVAKTVASSNAGQDRNSDFIQEAAPILNQETGSIKKNSEKSKLQPKPDTAVANLEDIKMTDQLKNNHIQENQVAAQGEGSIELPDAVLPAAQTGVHPDPAAQIGVQAEAQAEALPEAQAEAQGAVQAEAQVDQQTDGQSDALDDNQDVQSPSLTEDNDGERQDFDEDDDNQEMGAPDTIKNTAPKPLAVEKKSSQVAQNEKISSPFIPGGNFEDAEDSHFFAYFMSLSALCVLGYLVYHNKRKIIAMAVEGKKGRNPGRRRPNSASYHKLDSNLEEAMSSNLSSTNSYVIY